MSTGEKFATISYTLGIYFKLLFFPHPLTYDYYPYHIPITQWSQWQAFVPLLLYVGLGAIALLGLRKKSIVSFSIIFYAISLGPVSNILFPVGAFMNERFIFVASVGFCLFLAWLLLVKTPLWLKSGNAGKFLGLGIAFVFLAGFSYKTIDRIRAWKDDFTLFTTDVKTSVNGAKSNCSAGGKLIDEAVKPGNEAKRDSMLRLSIKYLNHAMEIHPTYGDALLLLGNAWFQYNRNFDSVMVAYKRLLEINPEHNQAYSNLEIILAQDTVADHKIAIYEDLFKINPNRFEVNYNLGTLYGKFKNNIPQALYYLRRAYNAKPDSPVAAKDLGVAYGMSGRFDSSIVFLKEAVRLDPYDAQSFLNLGVSLFNTGNQQEAQQYFKRAKELNPALQIQ
jgi:tetratricopeptide (TPR) repeat protein